ncbi:DUF1592 domain-containing protein [Congregibacter litoralis]|uniref:DUF1592 domain-containing protein n=1 Tax=Congregibacter litoralis KT71 TaxID=314285 RepID=A4ADK5_9GAMM|nr:DUF1592 domain-containing protein [Congregibacter litoralis]EAQ95894.2 hypothetical protein KT71_11610 [Congregibacter litoralis KT71]
MSKIPVQALAGHNGIVSTPQYEGRSLISPGDKRFSFGALIATGVAICLLLTACGEAPEPEVSGASELRVRLLTSEQYSNSIAHIFGSDISESVTPPLPPLPRKDGLLASGAAFVGLTSDQVSQIQQAAATIAAQVVDRNHRTYLVPCEPASAVKADDNCATEFIQDTGRMLFRRPLESRRLADLVAVANGAAEKTGSFYEGLALALETLLISPEFLFVMDRAEPDPDRPGALRLDAYALASRLSFFLWNATPDSALLDAAARGELHSEAGRAAAVNRLLNSPRLETGMRAFFDDMLAFDDFDSLAKDPIVYPKVTARALADAREQTLRTIIDHLLREDADYRDLFTTRKTHMSMSLAALYGIPTPQGWSPYEFDEDSHRSGLLTHVSFLAANSHAVRSSPTLRGKAMRELLLCQHVPDPPPNVDFSKLEDAGNVSTARERLKVHNTNPSCAGCHLITDPMGLALENFDGAGGYRETENGAALDISGELDGVFFDDIEGLGTAMRNHPKLSACLVNRLYAYGTGGPVSLRYDRDILKRFEERFVSNGHRVPALLKDLSMSQEFSAIRLPRLAKEKPEETNSALAERLIAGRQDFTTRRDQEEANR